MRETAPHTDPERFLRHSFERAAVLNLAGFLCAAALPQISQGLLSDFTAHPFRSEIPPIADIVLGCAAFVFLVPAVVFALSPLRMGTRTVHRLRVAIATSAVSSLAVPIFALGPIAFYAVNVLLLIGCPLVAFEIRSKVGTIPSAILAVLPVPFILFADVETLSGFAFVIVCPVCLVVALALASTSNQVEKRWAAIVGTLPIWLSIPVLVWTGILVLIAAIV